MKPFNELNDIQRAQLLFDLFPSEIPKLVAFISNMCITIREEEQRNRASWNHPQLDFDMWLNRIYHVSENLKKFDGVIERSAKLFSEELFDRFRAVFTTYCLRLYVTTQRHPNEKFATTVKLLFD